MDTTSFSDFSRDVQIRLNIDGLSMFHSVVSGFWPILADIIGVLNSVFVVGLYYGSSKPCSSNEFLEDLINEINTLGENGPANFSVVMCCCDIPARTFVKVTKGHCGYFSCERCIQKGIDVNNRRCFLETDAQLRDNITFRSRHQPEHHVGESQFEKVTALDMIQFFPIDYMHCLCHGAF